MQGSGFVILCLCLCNKVDQVKQRLLAFLVGLTSQKEIVDVADNKFVTFAIHHTSNSIGEPTEMRWPTSRTEW